IGDKNYELSNHLGNVLSVITDKKIISTAFKEEILYQRFKEFKEDGEKTHISVNTSLQCVNTYNGTGTYLPLVLEANTEYNVKTTLVLENYHSAVNIIVEDQLGNNLFFTTLTETNEIGFTFNTTSNGEYKIRFLKNNLENPEDTHEEAFFIKD